MATIGTEPDGSLSLLESGGIKRSSSRLGLRTAHNMSSSSLRKRSDPKLVSGIQYESLRLCLANFQVVLLDTKLFLLFPAVPLAVVARRFEFGRSWVFALSLLGLTPLAERVSFLTEQIAHYTGPTVGGLLNATCGNATELIIAILALTQGKTQLVKYSLLGSVLSNLLLVLGTSLFCGGLANLNKQQKFDSRQAEVNCLMLFLGLLCHTLPMLLRHVGDSYANVTADTTLQLSRASSVVMLVAYSAFLIFQLCTHRHFFEPQQDNEDDGEDDDQKAEEELVISFWSGFVWLVGMTLFIALLSEFLVGTIEDAADSWGLSVSFISIILLPIVGNAAEHAGAVIFAFKNKLDITLGVALGSATQISMFVVPLCVVIAWIIGIDMDLDFDLLQTASLALSIIATTVALQGGTSHYMKGLVLLLCYVVISTCFFLSKSPQKPDTLNLKLQQSTTILGAS